MGNTVPIHPPRWGTASPKRPHWGDFFDWTEPMEKYDREITATLSMRVAPVPRAKTWRLGEVGAVQAGADLSFFSDS